MTRCLGRSDILNTKNSTVLPSSQFGMNCQCFTAARLTWPAYVNSRKLENRSVCKDRIIVASTCRRSVQFGCYIACLWMANCVSVMVKLRHLFNFTVSCNVIQAWKTSRCAHYPEAVSDWLNPLSLGTMSASAYIYNLA